MSTFTSICIRVIQSVSTSTASGARYSKARVGHVEAFGSGLLRYGLNFSTAWCTIRLTSVEKHCTCKRFYNVMQTYVANYSNNKQNSPTRRVGYCFRTMPKGLNRRYTIIEVFNHDCRVFADKGHEYQKMHSSCCL